jgi:hypothetical protein
MAAQLSLQIIAVNPGQKVCDIAKHILSGFAENELSVAVSYHFYRPDDAKAEAKVWEVLVLTFLSNKHLRLTVIFSAF